MNHIYEGIKGWTVYLDLYREMVAQGNDGDCFVEIGTFKGRSAAYMGVEIINSGKDIKFYTVDHFLGSPQEGATALNLDEDVVAGRLYEVARQNLSPLSSVVNVICCKSTQAPSKVNRPVNFLFIDGAHDYQSVKEDLDAWLPMMTVNGVVAGDDWNWAGVQRAVNEKFPTVDVRGRGEGKPRYWVVKL